MPYESIGDEGAIRLTPISEQDSFYNSHFSNTDLTIIRLELENSPLGKMRKHLHLVLRGGAGRSVSSDFLHNTSTMDIRVWTVGFTGSPSSETTYGANQLSLSQIADEDGNRVREFTNKRGR